MAVVEHHFYCQILLTSSKECFKIRSETIDLCSCYWKWSFVLQQSDATPPADAGSQRFRYNQLCRSFFREKINRISSLLKATVPTLGRRDNRVFHADLGNVLLLAFFELCSRNSSNDISTTSLVTDGFSHEGKSYTG